MSGEVGREGILVTVPAQILQVYFHITIHRLWDNISIQGNSDTRDQKN